VASSDPFSGVLSFVRCAELCSFTRAAADLGVTTAAISKAVKKLEEELGVSLLERSSRSVVLTKAGEVFLERGRQALLNVQGAREAVQSLRREPRGDLFLTMPFILGSFVLSKLTQLSAQSPRLSYRMNMSDRIVRLADERYDIAVRMGDLEDSALVSRLLRRTRWVTVASPGYLSHRSAPRSPSDLEDHNCLRFVGPNGRPRDWSFRGDGAAVRVLVKGNLSIDNGNSMLEAAEAGLGLCQILDFMVEDSLRSGRLEEVLAPLSTKGPDVHALTTKSRAGSANVRAFMRFLADAFQS
jgi:DNA-binding transcriptional LysR family regulator